MVVCEVRHPVCEVRHPVCEVRHPVLEVRHPVREVRHPVCEVRHPVREVVPDAGVRPNQISQLKKLKHMVRCCENRWFWNCGWAASGNCIRLA